jgi:hypothetical protein
VGQVPTVSRPLVEAAAETLEPAPVRTEIERERVVVRKKRQRRSE